MPSGSISCQSASVRPQARICLARSNPYLRAYKPCTEAILTMVPCFRSRIPGSTARISAAARKSCLELPAYGLFLTFFNRCR